MEEWLPIEEFPDYEVSSLGRVRNAHTGRVLGIYNNGNNTMQVVMRRDGRPYARGVARLVATTFICPPPEENVVPIHIDFDFENCRAENLDWKPKWYASTRTRQHHRTEPKDPRMVRMVKTMMVYPNALECAKDIGGLESMVLLAAQDRYGATYMGSAFEFVY